MTKEQLQVLLNEFLSGKAKLNEDYGFFEDSALGIYQITHHVIGYEPHNDLDIEIRFPAKDFYQEAMDNFEQERTEENREVLDDLNECDLDCLYDYDNPMVIMVGGIYYEVRKGIVL